jgi:hypothetical protein
MAKKKPVPAPVRVPKNIGQATKLVGLYGFWSSQLDELLARLRGEVSQVLLATLREIETVSSRATRAKTALSQFHQAHPELPEIVRTRAGSFGRYGVRDKVQLHRREEEVALKLEAESLGHMVRTVRRVLRTVVSRDRDKVTRLGEWLTVETGRKVYSVKPKGRRVTIDDQLLALREINLRLQSVVADKTKKPRKK